MNIRAHFCLGSTRFAHTLLRRTAEPGTIEWNVSIQCARAKDFSSEQCKLYERNKSMYDGKVLQPGWNPAMLNGSSGAQAAPPAVPGRIPMPGSVQPSFRPTVLLASTPAGGDADGDWALCRSGRAPHRCTTSCWSLGRGRRPDRK